MLLGMQLISGSSDGLIRLWTIRSGECENTFDSHTDRVWAIATMNITSNHTEVNEESEDRGEQKGSETEEIFFSGGSDSKLIVWGDHTEREEKQRLIQAESTLLLEQQMQNDLRNKRYDKVAPISPPLFYSFYYSNPCNFPIRSLINNNSKQRLN